MRGNYGEEEEAAIQEGVSACEACEEADGEGWEEDVAGGYCQAFEQGHTHLGGYDGGRPCPWYRSSGYALVVAAECVCSCGCQAFLRVVWTSLRGNNARTRLCTSSFVMVRTLFHRYAVRRGHSLINFSENSHEQGQLIFSLLSRKANAKPVSSTSTVVIGHQCLPYDVDLMGSIGDRAGAAGKFIDSSKVCLEGSGIQCNLSRMVTLTANHGYGQIAKAIIRK